MLHKLKAACRPAVWGGKLLKGILLSDEANIAEAWLYCSIPEQLTYTEQGSPLPPDAPELLIKIIDAAAPLSVQVHPDDAYAHAHGLPCGKSEMWHILRAEPGAQLIYGTLRDYTPSEIAAACTDGSIEDMVKRLSVRAGDTVMVPPGMVHAIGGGITLLEIQQPSDTTYRLYDYGRPRELHTECGSECVKFYTADQVRKAQFSLETSPIESCIMAHTRCTVEHLACNSLFCATLCSIQDGSLDIHAAHRPLCLICTAGQGSITHEGHTSPIAMGDAYYLPEGSCTVTGTADTVLATV